MNRTLQSKTQGGIPRRKRTKFTKEISLSKSHLELFQKKSNNGMEKLKSKVKQLIQDTNKFQKMRKSQDEELASKLDCIEKDRIFKGKIQHRILSKLLVDKPMSIHHIKEMRELSEKHRVSLYLHSEYKECLEFFKRWENYFEVQAHRFSLRGLKVFKDLLEYHRILLFEGACFTEKDAENVDIFL